MRRVVGKIALGALIGLGVAFMVGIAAVSIAAMFRQGLGFGLAITCVWTMFALLLIWVWAQDQP